MKPRAPTQPKHPFPPLILLALLILPLIAHEGTHESLTLLQAQIKATPNDPALHLRRAQLLIEHQEPQAALLAISRAEELIQPSPASRLLRADALIHAKRPLEAIALLTPLITESCGNRPALALRAHAHRDACNPTLAILDCRTLLESQPDPDIGYLAADLLVATHQHRAAIRLLDASFPSHPASTDLRALEIEISLKDWPAAHTRIDRRIATARRPEPDLARKAELYTRGGQPEQAMVTWKALAAQIQQLPAEIRVSTSLKLLSERANQAIQPTSP